MGAEARRDAISTIVEFPQAFRAVATSLSEAQLATRYREGGWTARQVIHHVTDSHINAYVRTRWLLTEDRPTIKAYDEKAWAELPDATSAPIELSLALLAATHQRWTLLLESLPDEAFGRELVHPREWPDDARQAGAHVRVAWPSPHGAPADRVGVASMIVRHVRRDGDGVAGRCRPRHGSGRTGSAFGARLRVAFGGDRPQRHGGDQPPVRDADRARRPQGGRQCRGRGHRGQRVPRSRRSRQQRHRRRPLRRRLGREDEAVVRAQRQRTIGAGDDARRAEATRPDADSRQRPAGRQRARMRGRLVRVARPLRVEADGAPARADDRLRARRLPCCARHLRRFEPRA